MPLKLVQFPIQWLVKELIVTFMNNVTSSQPAYPYSKSRKMDLLLTNFFSIEFFFLFNPLLNDKYNYTIIINNLTAFKKSYPSQR